MVAQKVVLPQGEPLADISAWHLSDEGVTEMVTTEIKVQLFGELGVVPDADVGKVSDIGQMPVVTASCQSDFYRVETTCRC